MNRLRILFIGAALMIGGSALASAQPLPRGEAYHDRYEQRVDNHYRVVNRDYRYDHDHRFAIGSRRWDGHRWQVWNGNAWCY